MYWIVVHKETEEMPPRKKTEVKPETPVVFANEKTALTTLAKLLLRKGVLDKDEYERVLNELG